MYIGKATPTMTSILHSVNYLIPIILCTLLVLDIPISGQRKGGLRCW